MKSNKARVSKSNSKEIWDGHHFRSLAVLIEAGIAPAEAIVKLAEEDKNPEEAVAQLAKYLKRGRSFAQSFAKTRLLTRHEIEILQVAEHAGEIPRALKFIASAYEKRQSRIKKVKTRLWYPTALLVVALLSSLMLAVFSATSSQLFSPAESLLFLMIVLLFNRCLLVILNTDGLHWISVGWRMGLQNNNKKYQQFFEYYWYSILVWMIAAGVDYQSAMNKLEKLLSTATYAQAVKRCQDYITSGKSATSAMNHAGLILTNELRQVIHMGENAGRWTEAVSHYLKIQQQNIDLMLDSIYEWIPKLYYGLIVLVIGLRLIGY